MSLIDGLILSTINDGKTKSQHSLLMEFYSLDREIDKIYDERDEKYGKMFDEAYDNCKGKTKSKQYKEAMEIAHKEFKSWDLSLHFMRYRAISLLVVLGLIGKYKA